MGMLGGGHGCASGAHGRGHVNGSASRGQFDNVTF
jgi:hypothetical protein